jgi:hypothetical protein
MKNTPNNIWVNKRLSLLYALYKPSSHGTPYFIRDVAAINMYKECESHDSYIELLLSETDDPYPKTTVFRIGKMIRYEEIGDNIMIETDNQIYTNDINLLVKYAKMMYYTKKNEALKTTPLDIAHIINNTWNLYFKRLMSRIKFMYGTIK